MDTARRRDTVRRATQRRIPRGHRLVQGQQRAPVDGQLPAHSGEVSVAASLPLSTPSASDAMRRTGSDDGQPLSSRAANVSADTVAGMLRLLPTNDIQR